MDTISFQNPDLHLHSCYSDGSDTPEQLLEQVRKAGVDIFSLTDHDTYQGCGAVREILKEGDPFFIGGVEFSCKDFGGRYHILGYCYDVNKPSIREAVNTTHQVRINKAKNRLKFLAEVKGMTFTEEETRALLDYKNPGKPHFANFLVKKGYAADKTEAFAILAEYKGKEQILTPEEAIDAILLADGIPVLAHGIKADGSKNLSEEEITLRVSRLKEAGLMGLECYYSGYTPDQQEIMLRLAADYNLSVTAGSDYHGTNKAVPLGDTHSPDPERMARFYKTVARLLEE